MVDELPFGAGFAQERLARGIAIAGMSSGSPIDAKIDEAAVAYARSAFSSEPTTEGAVTVLALDKALDFERRRDLVKASQRLSRRNNLAVAWLIEDSSRQGDFSAMITQLDFGMRRGGQVAGVMSGNLVKLLANPDAVPLIREILMKDPKWSSRLWSRLPTTPEALVNGAQLRVTLATESLSNAVYDDDALIAALVDAGAFDQAAEVYRAAGGARGTGGELIANASFDATNSYAPLDWKIGRTGTHSARLDRSAGTLTVRASNARRPLFARQLVNLAHGSYVLSMKVRNAPAELPVRLRLSCAEEASQSPPREFDFSSVDSFDLAIGPSSCRYLWLDLVSASNGSTSIEQLAIDSISLKKAS